MTRRFCRVINYTCYIIWDVLVEPRRSTRRTEVNSARLYTNRAQKSVKKKVRQMIIIAFRPFESTIRAPKHDDVRAKPENQKTPQIHSGFDEKSYENEKYLCR